MPNTYYTSLSGMLAASYGLQNTSNNVANMQTAGFKRSDVFYSSIGHSSSSLLGSGVHAGGISTNFSQGRNQATGNRTHIAITGQGFFIVKLNNNELAYTRSGDFEFNKQGVLIDKRSGGEVQGYDAAHRLVSIHDKGPKNSPGKPSSSVYLKGEFIRQEKSTNDQNNNDPIRSKYKDNEFTLENIYDKSGKEHTIHIKFKAKPVVYNDTNPVEPDSGLTWILSEVTCDGELIYNSTLEQEQKIEFSGDNQSPQTENSSVYFTLKDGLNVTLNCGTYMDGTEGSVVLKQVNQDLNGSTQIEINKNSGYGVGNPLDFAFDEQGQINYYYDNGQELKGIHIGLARFTDVNHELSATEGSLFKANLNATPIFGRANKEGFGAIAPEHLEESNVDPTMEFATIVVLQRMFQACSQIMNIDKQLFEELEHKS